MIDQTMPPQSNRPRSRWGSVGNFGEEVNELLGRLGSEVGERGDGWRSSPTDVSETEQELGIRIDLPGVRPQDVQPQDMEIEHQGTQLMIRGERPRREEQSGRTDHRQERGGRFVRTLRLPCEIQEGQVRAEFHDAVLRTACPKSEQAQPKRIEIKT